MSFIFKKKTKIENNLLALNLRIYIIIDVKFNDIIDIDIIWYKIFIVRLGRISVQEIYHGLYARHTAFEGAIQQI